MNSMFGNKKEASFIKRIIMRLSFLYFYKHGVNLYQKKEQKESIAYFEKAFEINPDDVNLLYNMGLLYHGLGEYDKAVKFYKTVIEKSPFDTDCHYNLGLVYYQLKDYQNSVELLQKARSFRKNDADIILSLSLGLVELSKTDEALDNIAKNLEEPEETLLTFGQILEERSLLDPAINAYKKILDFNSKKYDAYFSLAVCYSKKGELENALEHCNKALSINHKSVRTYNQLGFVSYCNDDPAAAISFYLKGIKINSKICPEIYENLAYAYESTGDTGKALKTAKLLKKICPDYKNMDLLKSKIKGL